MSCHEFRSAFQPGSSDASLLEHLRHCDACLDFAAHVDPDVMFRAIGGEEIIPPGGVDAFVQDVMHSVQLRSREGELVQRTNLSWMRGLAAAAALAAVVATGTILFQSEHSAVRQPVQTAAIHRAAPVKPVTLTTKPIVETYSSDNATIVEVPSNGANDVQMVMIFDDNLPKDL